MLKYCRRKQVVAVVFIRDSVGSKYIDDIVDVHMINDVFLSPAGQIIDHKLFWQLRQPDYIFHLHWKDDVSGVNPLKHVSNHADIVACDFQMYFAIFELFSDVLDDVWNEVHNPSFWAFSHWAELDDVFIECFELFTFRILVSCLSLGLVFFLVESWSRVVYLFGLVQVFTMLLKIFDCVQRMHLWAAISSSSMWIVTSENSPK